MLPSLIAVASTSCRPLTLLGLPAVAYAICSTLPIHEGIAWPVYNGLQLLQAKEVNQGIMCCLKWPGHDAFSFCRSLTAPLNEVLPAARPGPARLQSACSPTGCLCTLVPFLYRYCTRSPAVLGLSAFAVSRRLITRVQQDMMPAHNQAANACTPAAAPGPHNPHLILAHLLLLPARLHGLLSTLL